MTNPSRVIRLFGRDPNHSLHAHHNTQCLDTLPSFHRIMSPLEPPPTGCAYPAVALTCGYQYYEGVRDALIPPAPPSNSPELVIPTPKSTGCSALLHSSATMTMAHTWRAPAAGVTSNVIPLEARYFDLGAAALLRLGALAECGCAMDGVGCQLCGNALGARFSPCAAHSPTAFGIPLGAEPRSTTPTPQAQTRDAPMRIQTAIERYESLVRTAFPPQRRLDAQSLGVPRDFAPRCGDVFEGYEAVYGGPESARAVREAADAHLGASGVR
ncbi:hypothetical protein B0H11DRAFT_2257152 [Mycena galericulata]|nr:hypothetical protein B0H11DRAFT_2257152 [Mycena galericulata]